MISDDEAKENISARVSLLLEKRSMTQAELARKTGASKMAITQMIQKRNVPRASLLARVAEALKCSVDDLLEPLENFSK